MGQAAPPKLFEAVPNFSEGRDREKISRIANSVRNAPGVIVLNLHSDPDHNRSVLTFIGEEEPLLRASVALTRACKAEIDLAAQSGVHPTMGALDILPFVPLGPPLSNTTLEDATRLAKKVGEAIGISGLPARVEDPLWKPDYGPEEIPPRSGAVAVGARPFLVAFNAYLDTDNLELA